MHTVAAIFSVYNLWMWLVHFMVSSQSSLCGYYSGGGYYSYYHVYHVVTVQGMVSIEGNMACTLIRTGKCGLMN